MKTMFYAFMLKTTVEVIGNSSSHRVTTSVYRVQTAVEDFVLQIF